MSARFRVTALIAAATGGLLLAASALPAAAQQTIPGSWGQSCRDGYIQGDDFTAECRTYDGRYRRSTIDLDNCRGGAVGNADGYLVCETGYVPAYGRGYSGPYFPPGSWSASCNNARIVGDDLVAVCRDRRGNAYEARLDLDACPDGPVANIDGRLVCDRPNLASAADPRYGMPPGAWRKTCNDARIEGDTLIAYCRGQGVHRKTSIDLDTCPGRELRVVDGRLYCDER